MKISSSKTKIVPNSLPWLRKERFPNESLIEAIRNRPPLWNMQSAQYRNRQLRKRLWADITKELNIETNSVNLNQVRKRWDQLRSAYIKNQKYPASDDGRVTVKPYRYEKLISFLEGVIVPSRRSCNFNEILRERTDSASYNSSSLQSEMGFEYVDIKQEPDGFMIIDQQDIPQPGISTTNNTASFLEIKIDPENIPTPPSPIAQGSSSQGLERKLFENMKLITSTEIHIKSENNPIMVDQACQTEGFYIQNSTEDHKDELIATLKRQNEQLKESLATKVGNNQLGNIPIESLKGQNERVRKLTGLPNFATMEIIFKDVEKFLPSGCRMSEFDIFFMTWMKLKLNIPLSYLSILMNISVPKISRLFHETFIILYDRLSEYIVWSNDMGLRKNTPSFYKQFIGNKHFIIVDCFEMFSERIGKELKSTVKGISIQTCKSKSRPQPIKHLICFSSTGQIIYLSKPFKVGLSKSCLAQQSGFIDRLDTYQTILATREFVSESRDNRNRHSKGIVLMVKNVEGNLEVIPFENTEEFIQIRQDVEKRIILMKKRIRVWTKYRRPVSAVTNKYGAERYSDFIIKMACAVVNLTIPQGDSAVIKEENLD